ncbi:MAG: hypothetical protein HY808_15005 [Nitrospirae bacterium]|nr:hypothetical protein [Nitrospirota bacterium]
MPFSFDIAAGVKRIQLGPFTFGTGRREIAAAERDQIKPMKKKHSVSISSEKTFYFI